MMKQARLEHRKAVWFLLAICVIQIGFIGATYSDPWFEDDAPHRLFVRDHSNPIAYFGPTLVKKLSLGYSVTPWFPFTFWMDSVISESPTVAYLHSGLSLFLSAVALYGLLCYFMSRRAALATSLLWLVMPSTVVTTEFLSTRHYLEGFLFSCIALILALESNRREGRRRHWLTLAALLFYVLATTTKEVHVSATFCALILFFANAYRLGAILATLACGALYATYRLVSLGVVGKNLGTDYADSYSLFLSRWPYMLTASQAGYGLLLLGLLVLAWAVIKKRLGLWHFVFVLGMTLALLVTIFPVSAHVTETFTTPGTWYRVIFLLNSFALALGAYWLSRLDQSWLKWSSFLVVFALLAQGDWQTTRYWDQIKTRYRADADFYVKHPDRLLYSDLPAPWYLYGVHGLHYGTSTKRYITWRVDNGTPINYIKEQLAQYDTIWVYVDGEFQSSRTLLDVIARNVDAGVTPLHQGWQPETAESTSGQ